MHVVAYLCYLSCTDKYIYEAVVPLLQNQSLGIWHARLNTSYMEPIMTVLPRSAHNTPFHFSDLVVYNNMPSHKTSFLAGLVLRTPTSTPVHDQLIGTVLSCRLESLPRSPQNLEQNCFKYLTPSHVSIT